MYVTVVIIVNTGAHIKFALKNLCCIAMSTTYLHYFIEPNEFYNSKIERAAAGNISMGKDSFYNFSREKAGNKFSLPQFIIFLSHKTCILADSRRALAMFFPFIVLHLFLCLKVHCNSSFPIPQLM
jgi:hypothetical protein